MAVLEKLNVGIVGAAGRGWSFKQALEANGARVHALCDIRSEELAEKARELEATETYQDYGEMLDRAQLDAVVIGTPMPLHVPQSIQALEKNMHVLCEVPAGVSIEQCRRLVAAAEASDAVYMMAENCIYRKANVLVGELVRQGLFGQVYYAEGEYLHELKGLNEITKWRRKWQTGIAGVTYCTHSLGPILKWMPGDRVVRVCCTDTETRYKDPRGNEYAQTTPVMLCKTAKGALIKIRVDMLSNRPHAMTNYSLQGTDGVYESGRGGLGETGKIWLRQLSQEIEWHALDAVTGIDELARRYLPVIWRDPPAEALRAGHGGGDFFEILEFMAAVRGEKPCPIGIHEAMDMTLPGLVSQQSVQQDGRWMFVPDSRRWLGKPVGQLEMRYAEKRLATPPVPKVPEGYRLRCYRPSDEPGLEKLMHQAGFEGWAARQLRRCLAKVLPDGYFLIEQIATGRIVAAALAEHSPSEAEPGRGELGWVAGHAEHRGKGLGLTVCAAATARLINAGYRNIVLLTDDWRLPAIKIYLQLGYEPVYYKEDMPGRWRAVLAELGWKA